MERVGRGAGRGQHPLRAQQLLLHRQHPPLLPLRVVAARVVQRLPLLLPPKLPLLPPLPLPPPLLQLLLQRRRSSHRSSAPQQTRACGWSGR